MCDIYSHQCNYRNCINEIGMHLVDYDTKRDEIRVFCELHIPEERKNGVVWQIKEPRYKQKIFVESLTENARNNWDGNCFNGRCTPIEQFGEKPD